MDPGVRSRTNLRTAGRITTCATAATTGNEHRAQKNSFVCEKLWHGAQVSRTRPSRSRRAGTCPRGRWSQLAQVLEESGEPKRGPHEGGPAMERFLNASQEPLWARNMRPLRLPDPCPLAHTHVVVCKVSGPPVLCYASHWLRRPHIHPAVTVGGPYWHSVCDGFHVFLVLGQYLRIVVIMRLRILATIAIDPLFEIIRTIVATNSCTSPRSHIGTSSVPPPTTMGADPASAFFFWR